MIFNDSLARKRTSISVKKVDFDIYTIFFWINKFF